MAVFAVISESPNPALRLGIEGLYPGNFYHWSDRVSFVTASGPAQRVSETLGVRTRGPDGTITQGFPDAIVVQLAPSYWGWTGAGLWAWLTSAFQRDGA